MAQALSISEDEVIARLENMLAAGVIRRIAAVPNHYRIGFKANGMTVWDVDDERIDEPGRNHAWGLSATVISARAISRTGITIIRHGAWQ